MSEEAKDFIRHLIVVDGDKRYDYDQIIAHPWVASNKKDRHDLTANLTSLEQFSKKKREIAAKMKAHEAALIMEDLMFGFGDDDMEEVEEESDGSGEDGELDGAAVRTGRPKRKTLWEVIAGVRKSSVKG